MEPSWEGPRTEAEASAFERTSTSAQVSAFVAECAARSSRIVPLVIGESTEKKPVALVLTAEPRVATLEEAARDPRLKVVVMANIHAGEVEGKEAVLVLLREIARGGHEDLLRRLIVAWVPNYNPDGNDRIDRRNRPDQAGPVQGVGERQNGGGLDLNRDYVKVEAPETEALIRSVRALDAALVVDLHTTNGSFHGYDLTYAGPLHPGTDPGLLELERRTLLPELARGMKDRHGFATFDYGNWIDENNPASGWASFEAVPRFGNSYFGLRNRLTVLSEAYSHDPFEKRIRSTRALIVETLAIAAARAGELREVLAAADAGARSLHRTSSTLPTRARLFRTHERHPVEVGGVRSEKDPVTGLVRQWDDDVSKPVPMPVFAWFEGLDDRPVREGWIVAAPSPALLRLLDVHGIANTPVAAGRPADLETFQVDRVRAANRPFQGHHLRTYEGRWVKKTEPVPEGTVYIPAEQSIARLAFVLLEPESEDGFGTWGVLGVTPDAEGGERFGAARVVAFRDR